MGRSDSSQPPRFNSYDVTLVTNGLFNENQGIGTDKHLVGLSEIVSENVDVASGSQENIVSFSSTMRSAKVRTMFNLGNNEYQSAEINMVHDGTNVSFSVWGDMALLQIRSMEILVSVPMMQRSMVVMFF